MVAGFGTALDCPHPHRLRLRRCMLPKVYQYHRSRDRNQQITLRSSKDPVCTSKSYG